MKQGASRHALKERGNDLYETPSVAVRALIRAMPSVAAGATVWEPCAGRGAIARELTAAGARVIAQDLVAYEGADPGIATPIDFLMERAVPAGVEMIVTNPPYKLADAFIRHGLELGLPVIVLLRLMAIEGAGRSDLMDRHCAAIFAGIERLPTMHREGWTGKRCDNSGAPFAWFVFLPEGRRGGAIQLTRISWREP